MQKFLNEHHWLIDICSKGFCLQEEKATLHLFNFTCSVWSDPSMIKHNYFNVNQWASLHPETVITRHSQPVCKFHSLWHCSPFIEIKSNVCCKTTTKAPSQPGWIISGALLNFWHYGWTVSSLATVCVCVSRFLLTLLLLLQSVGEMCFLFLLPSLCVSSSPLSR